MPGIFFASSPGGKSSSPGVQPYLLANGLIGSNTASLPGAMYQGDVVVLSLATSLTGTAPYNVPVCRQLLADDKTAHYLQGTPIAGILGIATYDVQTSGVNTGGANAGGAGLAPPALGAIATGAGINYPLSGPAMLGNDVATNRSYQPVVVASGNIFAARMQLNSTDFTTTATVTHQYDNQLAGFKLITTGGITTYYILPETGLPNIAGANSAAADCCLEIIGVNEQDPLYNTPITLSATALSPLMYFRVLGLEEYDPGWKNLFHLETTTDRYVWHQGWTGYPTVGQFRVPGQTFEQAAVTPNFSKQYIIRNYGLSDAIPMEDIEDDLYAVINKILARKGGMMATAFNNLMEFDTSTFFTVNGFASGTSVAGMADGVSLFNTAHPMSASNRLTTWSNRPSVDADISIATAQAAETNLMLQLAPDGITRMKQTASMFTSNPSLQFIAKQVFRGKWEVNTANRNENEVAPLELNFWPYFTSHGTTGTTNSWFVQGKKHYCYFILRAAYDTKTDYDISTNSQIIIAMCRFTEGASDARGTYGSQGY